jgi:ATP-dependent Lhr-like helicase
LKQARLPSVKSAISLGTRLGAQRKLEHWFKQQGWRLQDFQRETWQALAAGEEILLHAATGSGKTLAVWGGLLIERMHSAAQGKVLWITPLRALANDLLENLARPVRELALPIEIALRTGDASSRMKRLARQGHFDALVVTPESLSLLLSYPDTAPQFLELDCIVVDEWHELMGSKRGVLLELVLAHLRARNPTLRTVGISASLGNLKQAGDVLFPHRRYHLIEAKQASSPRLKTLLPEPGVRFAWAGHLGLKQLPRVLELISKAHCTLLFTNTRGQAELWHQALNSVWPFEAGTLGLHHGSLDRAVRTELEDGLRAGSVRCAVSTSSLDLGVDFQHVDQVIQVGSPKGIARLIQRAGRAKHRPGEQSEIYGLPTHLLELIEFAAAREALAAREVESKPALEQCFDVLAQHLATLALGPGLNASRSFEEVRLSHAFRNLSAQDYQRVLNFLRNGGEALKHYADYQRVVDVDDGSLRMVGKTQALRHRLSIGTIISEGSVQVRLQHGTSLGSVEESFVARMQVGDVFAFAGRTLKLTQFRELIAHVKIARGNPSRVAVWAGGHLPLSSQLATRVRVLLAHPDRLSAHPEWSALQALVECQRARSHLPDQHQLLVEVFEEKQLQHLFIYPFLGRQVHRALASLMAFRLAQRRNNTWSMAINDYGLLLSPSEGVELDAEIVRQLLCSADLDADLRASVNLAELEQRQFREVARVAGLLPPSMPSRQVRSLRSLQASSSLLFQTLQSFDPGHILLEQTAREVLKYVLHADELQAALEQMRQCELVLCRLTRLSPLAFPLWAERLRISLSNEDWRTRVERAARLADE